MPTTPPQPIISSRLILSTPSQQLLSHSPILAKLTLSGCRWASLHRPLLFSNLLFSLCNIRNILRVQCFTSVFLSLCCRATLNWFVWSGDFLLGFCYFGDGGGVERCMTSLRGSGREGCTWDFGEQSAGLSAEEKRHFVWYYGFVNVCTFSLLSLESNW